MFSESFEKHAGVINSIKGLIKKVSESAAAKKVKSDIDKHKKFREAGTKVRQDVTKKESK
jgi:hypothetical protein